MVLATIPALAGSRAFDYADTPFFFAHKDKEAARNVYATAALAYTIVASFMMLCILAYLDLFQLLLGKNFRDALEVVPVLLVSFLFLGIYYNVSAWYKLADKTLWSAWIACAGMIITVVCSVILIPLIGVMGSAWTALACYVTMVVMCYLLGQKYYPIPYRIWRMIGWMAVALVIYFIMEAVRPLYADKLAVILVMNTVLVGVFIFLVMAFEKSLVRELRMKE